MVAHGREDRTSASSTSERGRTRRSPLGRDLHNFRGSEPRPCAAGRIDEGARQLPATAMGKSSGVQITASEDSFGTSSLMVDDPEPTCVHQPVFGYCEYFASLDFPPTDGSYGNQDSLRGQCQTFVETPIPRRHLVRSWRQLAKPVLQQPRARASQQSKIVATSSRPTLIRRETIHNLLRIPQSRRSG